MRSGSPPALRRITIPALFRPGACPALADRSRCLNKAAPRQLPAATCSQSLAFRRDSCSPSRLPCLDLRSLSFELAINARSRKPRLSIALPRDRTDTRAGRSRGGSRGVLRTLRRELLPVNACSSAAHAANVGRPELRPAGHQPWQSGKVHTGGATAVPVERRDSHGAACRMRCVRTGLFHVRRRCGERHPPPSQPPTRRSADVKLTAGPPSVQGAVDSQCRATAPETRAGRSRRRRPYGSSQLWPEPLPVSALQQPGGARKARSERPMPAIEIAVRWHQPRRERQRTRSADVERTRDIPPEPPPLGTAA